MKLNNLSATQAWLVAFTWIFFIVWLLLLGLTMLRKRRRPSWGDALLWCLVALIFAGLFTPNVMPARRRNSLKNFKSKEIDKPAAAKPRRD